MGRRTHRSAGCHGGRAGAWTAAATFAACLVLAGLPLRGAAQARRLGPLVRVSHMDPFEDNLFDHPGSQSGFPQLRSKVEPWIAVNPANPSNIVFSFQQDRWSPPDGGARGIGVAASADGAQTWSSAPVIGIGLTTGGTYERDSDTWLSFAPDGSLYHDCIAFNDTTPGNAVLASKSTDGGLTWSAPATLIADTTAAFNDKNSITADPTAPGYVYAVWDRSGVPYIARTTNSGASWLAAQPLVPNYPDFTVGNEIVVEPDGALMDFFSDYGSSFTLSLLRSTDHGETWSGPVPVADQDDVGTFDPIYGDAMRTGGGLACATVDPNTGALYAVWMDGRFSSGAIDEIAFSASFDGGTTWSSPIKINQTPLSLPIANRQAFLPSVAVASDGTICVSYYDFRNTEHWPRQHTTLLTDCWAVFCAPGNPCTSASSWTDEVQLTDDSFDFHLAPYADGGRFIGDYMPLVSIGNDFIAAVVKTSPYIPALLYARRIYAPP